MASSSTVPAKRPRIDSDDNGQNKTEPVLFTRSELWWDDGNIVIQAESTRFRIYKGLLATQSEIFRDMFSIPQPPASSDQDELVEGCPVIRVSDSAKDWTYVLQALLERRYLSIPIKPIPFEVVAAFLRLGLKYNIEVLKTEASSRLAHHFPTSLEVYGDRDDAMITPDRLQPIMAINLARECRGMDRILPMAFFRLVVGFSFQGILCSDIPPDDRNIAIVGWESAVQAQAQETMRWLFQLDSGELYSECLQPENCVFDRMETLKILFTPIPTISDGLSHYDSDGWCDRVVMCESCKTAAKRVHNEGRKAFWRQLPTFFGLPGWDELLKEH